MGDVGKLARSGSIASDLKSLLPVISTRRTKVFAYGFVIAFVACTALLAFSPSGNASPWFNTLFTSSSSSSSSISTSIAPYRSQFSSLIFFFFPNSSSPSTESSILSQKPNNQTEMGVGSRGIGVPVGDQKGKGVGSQKDWMPGGIGSRGHGVSEKNQTEKEVGSGGNVVSENNRAEERVGSEKSGVLAGKNQTASGNGLQGTGFSVKNHTGNGVGFGENGVSAKNKKGGNDSDNSAVIVGKNQAVSGNGLQGTGVPAKNRPGKTGPENSAVLVGKNQTVDRNGFPGSGVSAKNPTGGNGSGNSAGLAAKNQTGSTIGLQGSGIPVAAKSQSGKGVSANNQKDPRTGAQQDGDLAKSQTAKGAAVGLTKSETLAADHKGVAGAGRVSDSTASPMKPKGSSASASNSHGRKRVEWIDRLIGCDIFQGRWVQDESYPLYPQGSCPHIDEPFDCYHNGRPDRAYQKLRWQPNGCNIPRLNATDMLERLRGKRLVFVGDSLNRNMWESLVCVLRNSVKDKRKVFEASGRHEFKTEGSYSFLFTDYGCTVEFFRSPFLVQEWEMPGNNGTTKETLRLDIVESSALKYKDAHVIVFNTGHWWTHEKTSKGRDYYQEGNHIYSELNVAEAFHKALNTWAKWVDTNVNPKKSLVFFRGYSASHFSGGRWNSGGQCHRETEPIKNEMYLSSYPPKMSILETVIKGMKTHVSYLNITRMTDYRKDAHPSIYRKQNLTDEERRSPEMYQDCSHWCLPGVPDSWNELLYAQLLIKQHQMLL